MDLETSQSLIFQVSPNSISRYNSLMKVLYVLPTGELGTAERFILDMAREHLREGKVSPTLYFFNVGPAVIRAKRMGLTVHALARTLRFSKPFSVLKACRDLREFVNSNNFEAVISNQSYTHILTSLALRNWKGKKIWYQHGPVGDWTDRLGACLPHDYVLFNSQHTLDTHCNMPRMQLPKFGESVLLPPVGGLKEIEPSHILNRRDFLEPTGKDILITCGGRMKSSFSYETLLYALEKLKADKPDMLKNVYVVILGYVQKTHDRPYQSFLRKMISKLNLEDTVEIVESKTPYLSLVSQSDLFVQTAPHGEPFSYEVAEAMMAKTFVIGSNQGGTTDILKDSETGVTFHSSHRLSADYLKSSLEWYLERCDQNNIEIERILRNARNFVSGYYNPQGSRQLMEALLEDLVNKESTPQIQIQAS